MNLVDKILKEAEENPFPKSKIQKTLYHGTYNTNLKSFDPNFDTEAENEHAQTRDYEVPSGVVFLTDDPKYAKMYGSKVLSVKVNAKIVCTFKVDTFPSRAFDDDYNGANKMWSKFEGSYDVLEIIGKDRDGNPRTTYITYPELCKVIK